jgi:replicative DNA helicase
MLAQLDREVDARPQQCPSVEDSRLRNPLDTQLCNKVLFLYRRIPGSKQTGVSLERPLAHEFMLLLDPGGALIS